VTGVLDAFSRPLRVVRAEFYRGVDRRPSRFHVVYYSVACGSLRGRKVGSVVFDVAAREACELYGYEFSPVAVGGGVDGIGAFREYELRREIDRKAGVFVRVRECELVNISGAVSAEFQGVRFANGG